MGWFGRKSAAAVRPFVPVWLGSNEEAGFVRSVGTPLGETVERYRVRVSGAAGMIEIETFAATASFTAAEIAALGPGIATIAVCQIGDFAVSREAKATILLG